MNEPRPPTRAHRRPGSTGSRTHAHALIGAAVLSVPLAALAGSQWLRASYRWHATISQMRTPPPHALGNWSNNTSVECYGFLIARRSLPPRYLDLITDPTDATLSIMAINRSETSPDASSTLQVFTGRTIGRRFDRPVPVDTLSQYESAGRIVLPAVATTSLLLLTVIFGLAQWRRHRRSHGAPIAGGLLLLGSLIVGGALVGGLTTIVRSPFAFIRPSPPEIAAAEPVASARDAWVNSRMARLRAAPHDSSALDHFDIIVADARSTRERATMIDALTDTAFAVPIRTRLASLMKAVSEPEYVRQLHILVTDASTPTDLRTTSLNLLGDRFGSASDADSYRALLEVALSGDGEVSILAVRQLVQRPDWELRAGMLPDELVTKTRDAAPRLLQWALETDGDCEPCIRMCAKLDARVAADTIHRITVDRLANLRGSPDKSGHPNDRLLVSCAEALGDMGTPEHLPVLDRFADSSEYEVRYAGKTAASRIRKRHGLPPPPDSGKKRGHQ